jgi:hypothetical protein
MSPRRTRRSITIPRTDGRVAAGPGLIVTGDAMTAGVAALDLELSCEDVSEVQIELRWVDGADDPRSLYVFLQPDEATALARSLTTFARTARRREGDRAQGR